MSHAVPTWDLRLSHAPELLDMAAARHGSERSSDQFQLNSWSIHFYKYEATLLIGDAELEITPGSVGVIPAGVSHEYRYRGRSEHLCAHFSVRESGGEAMPIAAL